MDLAEVEMFRGDTPGHWWEDGDSSRDAQHHEGRCMVESPSWADEVQDILVPQAEGCYCGGRSRLSSISVSDHVVRVTASQYTK